MDQPIAMPTALINVEARNHEAEAVITSYAHQHMATDVAIGILGTFVPFGGLAGIVASISVQAPLFYHPMIKKLAVIYTAEPDEITTGFAGKATWQGAGLEVLADVGADVAAAFGAAFFAEIAPELVQELGIGALASAVPVVGGFIAAGLDAKIAHTLTWRVGKMTAMYYMHDGWIRDRHQTYERAKALDGEALDAIPQRVPEINKKGVAGTVTMIRSIRRVHPTVTDEQIRQSLRAEKLPPDLIEQALKAA